MKKPPQRKDFEEGPGEKAAPGSNLFQQKLRWAKVEGPGEEGRPGKVTLPPPGLLKAKAKGPGEEGLRKKTANKPTATKAAKRHPVRPAR